MLEAENRFIKIIMGEIHSSPVTKLWLQWHQNWNPIIRRLKENIIGKPLIIQ